MSTNSEEAYSNPTHYTARTIQPIQVTLDWNLNFSGGNILKYLARAGRKNNETAADDYSKMVFYAKRLADQKGGSDENSKANHPSHYSPDSVYEVINIIEHFDLNFPVGNALKYILRAGRKKSVTTLDDINKAIEYLNIEKRRIQSEEKI